MKIQKIRISPAIQLLGIYSKKIKNVNWKCWCCKDYIGTCTFIFIAALFTIAMAWKQPSACQQMNV